jgi:hypothetical protein
MPQQVRRAVFIEELFGRTGSLIYKGSHESPAVCGSADHDSEIHYVVDGLAKLIFYFSDLNSVAVEFDLGIFASDILEARCHGVPSDEI